MVHNPNGLKTPKQIVKAYEQYGSLKAVARKTKTPWRRVYALYHTAIAEGLMAPLKKGAKDHNHLNAIAKGEVKAKPVVQGKVKALKTEKIAIPSGKKVARYFFTSIQNNTKIHEGLWQNLMAFCKAYDVQLHVSRFSYIKRGLGAQGDKLRWGDKEDMYDVEDMWFDDRLDPYMSDKRLEVAPGLVWCGEQNVLPTAVRPLSEYEPLTGRKSMILPHAKIAMESVAAVGDEPTKFMFTTGCLTMRNYIHRKAGLKAEFHHCYGGLLVEVDSDGNWYPRQVNADSTGAFYELDPDGDALCFVKNGEITTGHRAEALSGGDKHVAVMDQVVLETTWGEGGMIDVLKPRKQFMHDLLDFHSRAHHSIDDPFAQFDRHVNRTGNVRNEIEGVLNFLKVASRPGTETYIVDSNHDRFLEKWLKKADGRFDPLNVEFWHDLGREAYRVIREQNTIHPQLLREAVKLLDPKDELGKKHGVKFLPMDKSFVICVDAGGGIECSLHGDLGPNGQRGSAAKIAKMGRKANIGHSHVARIVDGVYQAGTSSRLRLEYNQGPSSWSQSHIVTYPNGKRAIYIIWEGKWRA